MQNKPGAKLSSRNHAEAVTNGSQQRRSAPVRSVYSSAVHQALIVLWEASDRLCSKRLKA